VDLVPETVAAALMSRIDRLDAPQRRVLEGAAVLGHEVPLPVLATTLASEVDLSRVLDALVRLEFPYVQPGPPYVFKHGLTQDVAYSRLTPAESRFLHRATLIAELRLTSSHRPPDTRRY
jgi:predicted ATPase